MLANMADSRGNWLDVTNSIRGLGIQLSVEQGRELNILQKWLKDVHLGAQSLEASPRWRWRGADGKWSGWLQTSKFWHKCLEMEKEVDDLTSKWPDGQYSLTWKAPWKRLWSKGGSTRTNLWTWRILIRTFFTGEQAAKMQVAHDPCARCKEATETITHLFYECRNSRSHWERLQELASRARVNIRNSNGLLATVDEAVSTKSKEGILFYIVYSMTNLIWKDRNHAVFRNSLQTTPLRAVLEMACIEIESSFDSKDTTNRWQRGLKMLEMINPLIAQEIGSTHHTAERNQIVIDNPQSRRSRRRLPVQPNSASAQ
ncbi:hypothetical protein R1flu_016241 [Riccia fluitans]|uniref:Reverse transcriptase zinc-binding domain-containing protein n=1 Tax=Riccia fluitans TaxID=41844 RepID=A0ABD1YM38_9MARC